MTEEFDPFANWTLDDWRRAAKRAEDAASTNALAWIGLRDASLELIVEIRRLQAEGDRRGPWATANEKRSSTRRSNIVIAKARRAEGGTVAQIQKELGVKSRRTVESYLAAPD